MDACQLTRLGAACARRGVVSALALLAMSAPALADELKLPETQNQYRELLQESGKDDAEGRSGRIYRIRHVSVAVKGQTIAPNPTVTNAVGGAPGVQPVPLIGKNIEIEREKDSRETRYEIAIQWADGSIGLFEQEALGGLREGDAVVVHGRTIERESR